MRDQVDVVTGRALRYGLLPDCSPGEAVQHLIELAGHDAPTIRRAIRRLDDGLDRRPGLVAERVRALLEATLFAIASDRAPSPALALAG